MRILLSSLLWALLPLDHMQELSPVCYIKKWSKAVGKPVQQDITFSTPDYVSWQPVKTLFHIPSAPCGYQFWVLILSTIFMLWLVARMLSSLNNSSKIMVYPLQEQFKALCVQISVIKNQTIQNHLKGITYGKAISGMSFITCWNEEALESFSELLQGCSIYYIECRAVDI